VIQATVKELTDSVLDLLRRPPTQCGTTSLMITGGRGAGQLYKMWREADVFGCISKPLDLFLTDERCVPHHDQESNFHLVMDRLFSQELPQNVNLHRMYDEAKIVQTETNCYEKMLPGSIDILLLSMGEDGHIASLFPNSPALAENKRKVLPVTGPKAPFQRLTITPPVIQSAKQVYVLAIGDEKRRKYGEALLDRGNINSMPARLVLDRTWIFDLDEEMDLCPKF